MRLNKYLANKTGISRRQADELISQGKVSISGNIVRLGQQIESGDRVFINGKEVKDTQMHTTILLNKPLGYLSSRKSQGGVPTVYHLLPKKYQNLKTAGRLDKDSSGLMIMSSDGDLIQRLTHPKYSKVKIYEIELNKPLEPLHQQMISDIGIDLPDGKSRLVLEEIKKPRNPDWAVRVASRRGTTEEFSAKQKFSGEELMAGPEHPEDERGFSRRKWRVIMSEGRNRQIRRTFGSLGYSIKKLHRTNIGPYSLGNLEPGDYREI